MDQMVATVQEWLNNTYSLGVTVDGITGNATFTALIKALQTEIGVTADGDFGTSTLAACPTLQEVADTETAVASNLSYILQGSFWCKGYNPGGFTGVFGPNTTGAVKSFQADAGIDEDGIVTPYILQGIMNTDGYAFTATDDIELLYKHEVQCGLNKYYGSQIGLIAPNGEWERKSHRNLIKACQIEWGTSADGVWGSGTMSLAPTISINTSGYTNSKRILQWALAINGFYSGNFEGNFDGITRLTVISFQELMALDADGIVGKSTWASLLCSYGNTARTTTAFDTSTRLTKTMAENLVNAGYTAVGRYLTNVVGSSLDKKMTSEELQIIEDAGLKVFPIYQTYGGEVSYFTRSQGQKDAAAAKEAAQTFGFPVSTTIYFAVDYDALMADITSNIVPYFIGANEIIGASYKVGVYGPRAVCNALSARGLAIYSFVANMSSGFTGNIGVTMPSNWSYDQIIETTVAGLGIDRCVASSRATAVSPSEFVVYNDSYDTTIASDIQPLKQIYELAVEYMTQKAISDSSVVASIFNINAMALQYLRSTDYEGAKWDVIAGSRDDDFIQLVKTRYEDFEPKSISITNPSDSFSIGFPHYAATLNACMCGTIGLNFNFIERDVDAFAGWAGDLMQMAAILQRSAYMGYNYFNNLALGELIGATTNTYPSFNLYTDEKDENGYYIKADTPTSGFDRQDLYADIDAYNTSRVYDLAKIPIYVAINDYYYGTKQYLQRYSIFKRELLAQFNKDSLYDVASEFTMEEVAILSWLFEVSFGTFFEDGYGEALARGFEYKINALINNESI